MPAPEPPPPAINAKGNLVRRAFRQTRRRVVRIGKQGGMRRWIRHFIDRNIVMRSRFQSERGDWVQQMVAQGVGVCSIPEYSVNVEGIAVRPVTGLTLSRQVTLVAVSGSGNPREVRHIMGIAATYAWLT